MTLYLIRAKECCMLKNERQQQILDMLHANGYVEISELTKIFNVSSMTVCRDLEELEYAGKLIRSRGGALLTDTNALVERPFNTRQIDNQSQKCAIADAALNTIEDGLRLFFGPGSTVWSLAQKLDNSRRLMIVTDAINISNELVSRPAVSVVQIGGEVRQNTLSTVGTFAEEMIRKFKCQHAYIGVTGIGSDGTLYVTSVAEAGLFRIVFEISSKAFILADYSKIGKEDFVAIGKLQPGYTLITDPQAPKDIIEYYESLGVNVIIAQ